MLNLVGVLPKIGFVHIPKTGGMSVRKFFLSLYLDKAFGGHTTEDYRLFSDSTLAQFGFFAGHSYFRDWGRLPQGTILFTILRDPVARAVSLYRYWNTIDISHLEKNAGENSSILEAVNIARTQTVESFITSDNGAIVEHLRGAYTSQFVPDELIDSGRIAGCSANATLEAAVGKLMEFNAVLTTESLNETFSQALARFGFSLCDATLPRENVSTFEVDCDLSKVRDILTEISPNDFAIYAIGQRLESGLFGSMVPGEASPERM